MKHKMAGGEKMKTLKTTTAIILFLLSVTVLADGSSLQSRKKHRGRVKKMETVSIGNWGGQHVRLEVTDSGAELDFDCAHGTIKSVLKLDRDGNFDVEGFYARERPGPLREDENQNGEPARFKGHVAGQKMTLTVMLTGTSKTVGTYTLELGKRARIVKCM
jgi:hypothetical protein